MNLTHRQLCELGARYLKQVYGFERILIEVGMRKECPDVFAFKRHISVLLECKASRADFLKDKKKPFRQNPKQGVGSVRLYLVNEGVATKEEIPEGWGLLIATDENTIDRPYMSAGLWQHCNFRERNAEAEIELMWSWEYRRDNGWLPSIDTEKVNVTCSALD